MIDRACLSLNNMCNLSCRYCNFRQENLIHNAEMLSESDINCILCNILEYSRHNGIAQFKMGIVGAGEPLLSFDKIKQIVEFAECEDTAHLFAFYTITNGTLFNQSMAKFFYNHKDRIALNFSLDGYEELHNYGKAEYKKTLEGIKLYEKMFQEKPVLNCTVSRQTLLHKEAVIMYFKENGFEKVNFSQIIDVYDSDLALTHREFLGFLRFVADTGVIVFRQNRKEKKYDCRTYGQLCGVGRKNIFITKQGIYPCCRFYEIDKYKLGEYDSSLYEVEAAMHTKTTPVEDGECYYDKHAIREERQ